MTVAGLQSLSERGIEVGMLYVDAANVPAVALYYDLGFTLHQVRPAPSMLDPIRLKQADVRRRRSTPDAVGDAGGYDGDRDLPAGREQHRSTREAGEQATHDGRGDRREDHRRERCTRTRRRTATASAG